MKTIVMTSPNMAGQITFTYNEAGTIAGLEITEPLTDKQYKWLFSYFPYQIDLLKPLKAALKEATFVERRLEVTFQMFWDRYNDKERSSKKKTEAAWNKMKEADQIKAFLYIPTYNRKRGLAEKKYATTYLNDELWNN